MENGIQFGLLLLSRKRRGQIHFLILQALDIKPNYPKALNALIHILSYDLVNITLFSSQVVETLESDKAVFVLRELGAAFMEKGEMKKAILLFERADQLAPEDEKEK